MALVVDTGPLFAALHRDDRDHRACAALFDTDQPVVVPAPVVVETEWLVTSRLGPQAFAPLYDDIIAGTLGVIDLTPGMWQRVATLCHRYADLPLGLVDAAVVAVAETLGETTVATLDHRHLGVVRPAHCDRLDLVP